MSNYSIKDLETLSGIKAHTIRIWEQRYNILNPDRTDTNIRYYSEEDVKMILNISLLNQNGHKISKIAQLSLDEINDEVIKLTESNLKYPEQVHALTLCMLDMDEKRFEILMDKNIETFGFEKTMIFVIYPFLNKVGMLWLTGTINPAQEHFISNLIRQKVISSINSLIVNSAVPSKKFVLYLRENEYHELTLLFAHYMLKSHGQQVLYLGSNLPFEDLINSCQIYKPDVILTVFIASVIDSDVQSYVNKLAKEFPNTTIFITGYQVVGQDIDLPFNVQLVSRLEHIYSIIEG